MGSQIVTSTNGNSASMLSFLYLKAEKQSVIAVYLGYFSGPPHSPISLLF